ncbi:MAG: HAD-IA family hydrolase [Gammaproteobacteria bacterium]|nr:HAD-IA family hydrolase [Gammaproteobacteria bacterium]
MWVLFDIGSTLIEGPPYGPGRRLIKALGLEDGNSAAVNNLMFRTPLTDARELGRHLAERFGCDRETAEREAGALWRAQIDEAWVVPGAAEALHMLAEADIPWAYISNIWTPFYQGFLRHFPKEDRRPSFLSYRLGVSKPDLGIYRFALRTLGIVPQNAVMIGDTYQNDIAPAIELGIKTIWLLHRPEKESADLQAISEGNAPAPDLTLQSIEELRLEHITALIARSPGRI